MASKYWIKLYHEILEDPKMGQLPDNVWRRAIELFLMAGELDQGGRLPNAEAIAWKLRLSCNESLHAELRMLNDCNILTKQEDGTWLVTKFAKRQSKDSDARRIAEFRKRQRKKKANQPLESVNYTDPTGNYPTNPVNHTGDQVINEAPDQEGEGCNLSLHERYTDIDIDTDKEYTTVGATPEKLKSTGPKTKLKDDFLSRTNLPMPKRKSDERFWWSNFQEILAIADGNCDQALRIQGIAIQHALNERLTISGPQSIVNLCRSAQAGQLNSRKQGGNNRAKPKPTFTVNPRTGDLIPVH